MCRASSRAGCSTRGESRRPRPSTPAGSRRPASACPEIPAASGSASPAVLPQQEEQAYEQELDADDLVIGGEDVLAPEAHRLVVCLGLCVGDGGHSEPPEACWATQALYSSGVCTNTRARIL